MRSAPVRFAWKAGRRCAAMFAVALALGACQSIHNPNIVAAKTLPDMQYHDPAPAENTRCDPTSIASSCRPAEDPKRCWDPDVRAAYPQMCNTVDSLTPKWRGGVKEEP